MLAACSTALSGYAGFAPVHALRIASGSTSMTLCTADFVSDFDSDRAHRLELTPAPGMRFVDWALRYDVDRERREVRTSIAGAFDSRAIVREGLGCVLARGTVPAETWRPAGNALGTPDPFPGLG